MWQKWQIITSYYLKLDRKKNIYIFIILWEVLTMSTAAFFLFLHQKTCSVHLTCQTPATDRLRLVLERIFRQVLSDWSHEGECGINENLMWNQRFSCKSSFTLDLKPKKCTLWALRGYCVKSLCHLSGSSRLSLCCMNGNVHAWLFLCSGWVTLCFLWCGFMWLVCF